MPSSVQPDDDGIPEVPENLTEISDAMLMSLFARYVAWQNYIDERVAKAEIHEARMNASLSIATARAMARSEEKQVARQRASTQGDSLVVQANEEVIVAKEQRKALVVQKDALERLANLVSRELSRRIGRGPTQRRADNWRP